MMIVGIDENGLGPLLGPLIVTAAAFKAKTYDKDTFWKLAGPDLPADDSKVLFSAKHPAKSESAFLSWLNIFGAKTLSQADLLNEIGVKPYAPLPCKTPAQICEPSQAPLPAWSNKKPQELSLAIWNRFDRLGIKAHTIKAHQACPGLLNQELAKEGMNKFRFDFELMIDLVKKLGAKQNGDLLALCGKIGSTRRYGPWLKAIDCQITDIVEETAKCSTYKIDGVGTLSFIRDGDGEHLPIAVASMVGKYLRELAMDQINAHLGRDRKNSVSGYRDRRTALFVEETTPERKKMSLTNTCFLRNS